MNKRKQLPDEVLEYFKKQGSIGGKKRSENLTPKQRSEAAREAVQARWSKSKRNSTKKD